MVSIESLYCVDVSYLAYLSILVSDPVVLYCSPTISSFSFRVSSRPGSTAPGFSTTLPPCVSIVRNGTRQTLVADRPHAAQKTAVYGFKGVSALSRDNETELYTAVKMPRPTVIASRVRVWKIPPAIDCWCAGSADMTYMFATLNSRSAPMTMRHRLGKMKAQYEESSCWSARRRKETV